MRSFVSSVGRFPHLQKYVNIQRFIFNGQPFVDFAGKIFQTYLLASPKLSTWQMNATNAGILYILYILIALFFVFFRKKNRQFLIFFHNEFFRTWIVHEKNSVGFKLFLNSKFLKSDLIQVAAFPVKFKSFVPLGLWKKNYFSFLRLKL